MKARRRRRAGFRRLGSGVRRRRIAHYRRARSQAERGAGNSHGLFAFGAVATVLYVLGVSWLCFGSLDFTQWPDEITGLQPGTLAGFLAAAVGPIAILWLTLAVIRQGKALRVQGAQLARILEQNRQRMDTARQSDRQGTDQAE